jgi:uncharacterized protein DUF1707/FHA domain-containing protein
VAAAESPEERDSRLRASDSDRDLVISELSDQFAEGRLSHDTFTHRVDAALRARFRGELPSLVADLPRPRGIGAAIRARCRRLAEAADRFTRKAPAPLLLPPGPQRRFTIGREPACDMMLADSTVSRWHASLVNAESGWLLDDLGSTNGTRVNGWRVTQPTRVRPGDFVSFGAATFVIMNRAA